MRSAGRRDSSRRDARVHRLIATVLLLVASNAFMTYAWYYHVKHKAWPLLTAKAPR